LVVSVLKLLALLAVCKLLEGVSIKNAAAGLAYCVVKTKPDLTRALRFNRELFSLQFII
jgi:hypothetical protein